MENVLCDIYLLQVGFHSVTVVDRHGPVHKILRKKSDTNNFLNRREIF